VEQVAVDLAQLEHSDHVVQVFGFLGSGELAYSVSMPLFTAVARTACVLVTFR
jgi:hypothetical protein